MQSGFTPSEFEVGRWGILDLVDGPHIISTNGDKSGVVYNQLIYMGSIIELKKRLENLDQFKKYLLDYLGVYFDCKQPKDPLNFVQIVRGDQITWFIPIPNNRFNCLYWYDWNNAQDDDSRFIYDWTTTVLQRGNEMIIHWFDGGKERGSTIFRMDTKETTDYDLNGLSMLINTERRGGCHQKVPIIRGNVKGRKGNA